ncbi:MAG TPA: NAD(P)/FAD-dependent oxidoreductase [Polyangiaceae bacterium]
MSAEVFDTIVVGARCAGASLAVHLTRAGQKVLLLDAAKLPSDQPMSTHFIGPVGMAWLDELGAGAEVRRMSPPTHVIRLDLVGTALDVPFAHGRAGHCLRRMHLDRLLQGAAVGAGAVLRDRTKVVGIVREGGRIVGVETESEGARSTHRAKLVIGADGRHSTVADLVGAEEYLGYDTPRFGYWAYWPAKAAWTSDPALAPFGAYIGFGADQVTRFIFQTDSNLLCIGATPLMTDLPAWKGRLDEKYLETMRAHPVTAKLVDGNQREGKLLGIVSARFGFRRAAGPGFALVGDAGLHKDPTPGFGITDALRDARNLAVAILAASDAALVHYRRQRDVDSIDLFNFAKDLADPGYLSPLNRLVYEKARTSPAILRRLSAQADREISPYEVVPRGTVMRWVVGAVLRGKLSVVPSLLAAGKRNAAVEQARAERLALLR